MSYIFVSEKCSSFKIIQGPDSVAKPLYCSLTWRTSPSLARLAPSFPFCLSHQSTMSNSPFTSLITSTSIPSTPLTDQAEDT